MASRSAAQDRLQVLIRTGATRDSEVPDAPARSLVTFAGFNVVDIQSWSARLSRPVVIVCRRRPDRALVRATLLCHVRGGERKWRAIERVGAPALLAGLYVQCAGVGPEGALAILRRHARYGKLPEPLRTAHLLAGGVTSGESSGRA